ncbi:MerR family transcriptional regulator [Spirochaeta isovalerica]|uniref:DNA-binding transcriptional MerR regulator n=1 Tax=Spirochaeta isovalerica TaxID=150 RepID=A0A841RDU6_9SPIO|nr:MerR family transcriptional regulator [Spirochaeta isovalerica]MBB6481170.1 DNA-binding transcriptional MerR regulator [Spirochaeta isovalerica]
MKRTKLIKSEVIKIFNTTKETLRHYENLGLIEPQVDAQNYRYYDFKEIRKLRQIFYLREMEIPLGQIKALESGDVSPEDFTSLLSEHHTILKEKLDRQLRLLRETEQLIYLLKDRSFMRSYSIGHFDERSYYLIDVPEPDAVPSMKKYYDLCSSLIEKGMYSERTFILIYPFDNLADPVQMDSRQGMEMSGPHNRDSDNILQFPAGDYLSVFYIYRDGGQLELRELHRDIETYLEENQFERIGDTVLEIEHPELSIILDESMNIYELQVKVRRKGGKDE